MAEIHLCLEMRSLSKEMQHFDNQTFMIEFDIFMFNKCNKAIVLLILLILFFQTHTEKFLLIITKQIETNSAGFGWLWCQNAVLELNLKLFSYLNRFFCHYFTEQSHYYVTIMLPRETIENATLQFCLLILKLMYLLYTSPI